LIRISIALGALVVALAAIAPATAETEKLVGTVGPGYTISLKYDGKKVTKLDPGKYLVRVTDKGSFHSFHLIGPGVNKVITSVGFTGTKSVTVTLKKGTYTYRCDPHRTQMHGSFTVS
jgi:plastocyanin